MAALPKGGHILEIGCAGGRDAKIFVSHGFKVIGIDTSQVLLKEAKKLVPRGTFLNKDLRKIKFPSNKFDGVWANAVLLHIRRAEMPRILKNFYRMLKPNGILHILVKKGKGEAFVKEPLSQNRYRFFTYFSRRGVEKLVREVGFKVVYSAFAADELGRKNVHWIVVWGKKSPNEVK